jgi:hypothetical protein
MNSISEILQTFSSDYVLAARTILRFIHFVGLALGLGGATVLDLMLMRYFVSDKITREKFTVFCFVSRLVNAGLIILWISGILFIVLYAMFEPDKLANEKIWAKLAIVWVLSVNGVFIHGVVLPRIRAEIGKPLFFTMSSIQRHVFLASGAVSVTSWYVPVALGALVQLNFKVPASAILTGYVIILITTIIAVQTAVLIIPAGIRGWRNWKLA